MSSYEPDADPRAVLWSFVSNLVDSVPGWENIWLEHQHAHGVQAPASFLRAVAYLGPSRLGAHRHFHDLDIEAAFEFLESAFGVDSTIDSLIAVSFLVTILQSEVASVEATSVLGAKLRAELERHRAGGGIPVPTPNSDFVHDLVRHHTVAAEALRDHLEDEEDELLPYLFMGDLVRAVIARLNTLEGRESAFALLAASPAVRAPTAGPRCRARHPRNRSGDTTGPARRPGTPALPGQARGAARRPRARARRGGRTWSGQGKQR